MDGMGRMKTSAAGAERISRVGQVYTHGRRCRRRGRRDGPHQIMRKSPQGLGDRPTRRTSERRRWRNEGALAINPSIPPSLNHHTTQR